MSGKNSQEETEQALQNAENELKKLKLKYKIVQMDKNALANNAKNFLTRQNKILEKLKEEESELKRKWKKYKKEAIWGKDCKEKRVELTNEREKYEKLCLEKKKQLEELEEKISKLKMRRSPPPQPRKKNSNDNKNEDKIALSLRDKLHNETVKYNVILVENLRLREQVDNLLKARARFNDSYQKKLTAFNARKKTLMEIIEKATAAWELRNESDKKLKTLDAKEKERKAVFAEAVSKLKAEISHYEKLENFLKMKGKTRVMADLELLEAAKNREKVENTQRSSSKLKRDLEALKAYAGSGEDLGEFFRRKEEENFALFNYINELNNEVETVKEELRNLKLKLRERKTRRSFREESREETAHSLKRRYEHLTGCVEEVQDRECSLENTESAFLRGLEAIFKSLDYHEISFVRLLDEDGMTMTNADLFLDIIEKRG